MKNIFYDFNSQLTEAINKIDHNILVNIVTKLKETSENGRKVILVGNGGSAAMASHVAVDLSKAVKIRAITFNESDLITCYANDYGYEHWVSKALKSYADKGDLVILISSSGSSKNIINAANTAKELGLFIVTLSGFSPENPLKALGDINLWVDSKGYNIVEMTHHVWLVSIVDFIYGKIEYTSN